MDSANRTSADLQRLISSLPEFLSLADPDIAQMHPPLQRAESMLVLAKAASSLLALRLGCAGVNPADHSIKSELERISLYEAKLERFMDLNKAAVAEAVAQAIEGGQSPKASPAAPSVFEEDDSNGPFLIPPPINPREGAPCTEWGIAEKNIFSVYHPEVLEHVSDHLFTPKAAEACQFKGVKGTFNQLRSYHLQGLNALHFLKLEMEALHEQLDSANSDVLSVRAQYEELKEKLGEVKGAGNVMGKELSDARVDVERLTGRVSQLETELEETRARLAKVEKRSSEMKKWQKSLASSLYQPRQDFQGLLDSIMRDISPLLRWSSDFKKKMDDMGARIKEMQDDLSRFPVVKAEAEQNAVADFKESEPFQAMLEEARLSYKGSDEHKADIEAALVDFRKSEAFQQELIAFGKAEYKRLVVSICKGLLAQGVDVANIEASHPHFKGLGALLEKPLGSSFAGAGHST